MVRQLLDPARISMADGRRCLPVGRSAPCRRISSRRTVRGVSRSHLSTYDGPAGPLSRPSWVPDGVTGLEGSPGHVDVRGRVVVARRDAPERARAIAPVTAVGRVRVFVRLEVVGPVAVPREPAEGGLGRVPVRLEVVAAVAIVAEPGAV